MRIEFLCVWWGALSNLLFYVKICFMFFVCMGVSVYRYEYVASEFLDPPGTGDNSSDPL